MLALIICNGLQTSSIKANIKQTRINKLRKHFYKKNHIVNVEISPVDHLTKKFILNPIEGSRSAPTRSSNENQSVMGWRWGQDPWKRFPYVLVSDVLCYKLISIIHNESGFTRSRLLDGNYMKVKIDDVMRVSLMRTVLRWR